MSEYVPTTEEIARSYCDWDTSSFDRWLAARDAEVAAKALEDAGQWYRSREPEGGWNRSTAEPDEYQVQQWEEWQVTATELESRAAALRASTGGESAPMIECPHWAPGTITRRKGCTACASTGGENRG